MNWIKSLFKRCEHEYEFVRNIYGDEINWCGGYRSLWKCKKCGKLEYRTYLQKFSICKKLDDAYDEYYKNKYEIWCNNKSDTLDDLYNEMIRAAECGECYANFILICRESDNDKYYYEKWFNENQLKTEVELDQKIECDEINKYKFHVRWKYKY